MPDGNDDAMLQCVDQSATHTYVDASDIKANAPWAELIVALREGFLSEVAAPLRHHHTIASPNGDRDNTLLLMPAWQIGGAMGVKLVSVVPSNGKRGLPAISSVYVLSDATTGAVQAVLEGGEVTARRTAATSALAVGYLSRKSASKLLIVGTGRLCRNVAQSHAAVRDLTEISIWGRSPEKARAAAQDVADLTGIPTTSVDNLETAVKAADIVTCVTLSQEPLVLGEWLQPGVHLDLIGGFTPDMRETDDTAIVKSDVYVDTLAGAPREAGDILQPLQSGVLSPEDICGDLFGLCRDQAPARSSEDAITLFKSAGHAVQDLSIAKLVVRNKNQST